MIRTCCVFRVNVVQDVVGEKFESILNTQFCIKKSELTLALIKLLVITLFGRRDV